MNPILAVWLSACPNWPCMAAIIAVGTAVVGFGIGLSVGKKLAARSGSEKGR